MKLKPNESQPKTRWPGQAGLANARARTKTRLGRLRLLVVVRGVPLIVSVIILCSSALLPEFTLATTASIVAKAKPPEPVLFHTKVGVQSVQNKSRRSQASGRDDDSDFPNSSPYDDDNDDAGHSLAHEHVDTDQLDSSYDSISNRPPLSENSSPDAANKLDQWHPLAGIQDPALTGEPLASQPPPPPPPPNKSFISIELIREVCRLNRGSQRSESLNDTYLNYCNRYKLDNLLSNEILMSIMHKDSQECEQILTEFIKLDELIHQFDGMFENLLTRYNCHNGYSVKWSCEDCRRAYKDWLCATHLPLYMNGERIKPCISFCERVEQRCPYLHPITKEQYGGQPVFICRDPNIPFIPEITPDIPFSEPKFCYDLCHLSPDRIELANDTLSKYDYTKCPAMSSIAEEVRKDPYYCGPYGHCKHPTSVERGRHSDHSTAEAPSSTLATLSTPSSSSSSDYEDLSILDEEPKDVLANKSATQLHGHHRAASAKKFHAHLKRLDELREVLANYKNQPKSHKFGHHVDHSSLVAQSNIEHHYQSLTRESLDYAV